MKPPEPILVTPLFPELLRELLEVLSSLTPEEWENPTSCPGWTVHDIALHLLDVEEGELSQGRDDFQRSFLQSDSFEELVASLNHKNGQWVEATRGISPRLLIDLLALVGEQAHQHFSSLDPFSTGPEVSWVAAGPAPM